MEDILEPPAGPPVEADVCREAPLPVDTSEVLDWDVTVELKPRPAKTVRAKVVYMGRGAGPEWVPTAFSDAAGRVY
jgi:hypothetical protein